MDTLFGRRRPANRRPAKIRAELLDAVSNAIETPSLGSGRFAPRARLAAIWTIEMLEKFAHHHKLRLSRQTLPTIRKDFVQTISILIYIQWEDWTRLDPVFLCHLGPDRTLDRTDRNIRRYELHTLMSDDFLGPGAGSRFFDFRYIFCPIDIEEESVLTAPDGWRLPFLAAKAEPRGKGGFGEVTKEVIAARHYCRSSDFCKNEVEVARKVFRSKLDFDREKYNLVMLRQCAAQHRHIVLPLATITIGHQDNILFPLAKMDLGRFLKGDLIPPEECEMDELIDEAINVAAALDHLHNRLGVSIRGYHKDLKPANILVYEYPPGSPRRSRVGKWMITDFGLSEIMRADLRRDSHATNGLPGNPATVTRTQRPMEGTYQAPEFYSGRGFSRRSDVWSFGCVLVRVFAFKLDGVAGLHRLDDLRWKTDDGAGVYDHDFFARGDPPVQVLNPHIENWIRSLPHRHREYSDQFLSGCAQILSSILQIDKNDRPLAHQVMDGLESLKAHLHLPRRRHSSSSLASSSETHSAGPNSSRSPPTPMTDPLPLTPPCEHLAILTGLLVKEIQKNNLAGIQRYLSEGVDVNTPSEHKETPLGAAVKLGDETVVRQVLEAGANVNASSAGGVTPLMTAARNGHDGIARLLLEKHADCTPYSQEGFTCLHYATMPTASFLSLESPSVDIPTADPKEETPLSMLVKHFTDNDRWQGKFHVLIHAGADVNRPDKFGTTPLRCAVTEGNIRAARLLIRNKARHEDFSTVRNMTYAMSTFLKTAWAT
ncbi:hypothetical protein BJX61DRAFT_548547 [Aspergillus egyptiacus]|nr:hypothetical protein BJX61DRAFT_548547 [Aspergillus egyptiacus]